MTREHCAQRVGWEGLGHGAGGAWQLPGTAGHGDGLFVVFNELGGMRGSSESFCFCFFGLFFFFLKLFNKVLQGNGCVVRG